MFKNQTFYHQHVKKAIIAFGMIFNNINVDRRDSDGNLSQSIRVPLSYSTKQKFLARIAAIPDELARGEVAITLPRMGFEIDQFVFDPARKVSPIQRNRAVGENDNVNTVRSTFVSTPYNMGVSLYVFAKNQEDALQIVEQILPYFNPDFNVTVNELPELGIKRDIKITLDGINYDDQYEGDMSARQSIIWTLNFTMRLNFYGYVSNAGVIKKAIANLYGDTDILTDNTLRTTSSIADAETGLEDLTLTPADKYDYIKEILEDFEGDNLG